MNNKLIREVKGNELLIDALAQAIMSGRPFQQTKDSPYAFILADGVECLGLHVLQYVLEQKPFDLQKCTAFCDLFRKHTHESLYTLSSAFSKWTNQHVVQPYFDCQSNGWRKTYTLKPETKTSVDPNVLHFLCYMAIHYLKYGASFESITAECYFDYVCQLGGTALVEQLKQNGSGTLPQKLTRYHDDDIDCSANDVTACISIQLHHDTQQAYRKALQFIITLFKETDFPHSYYIQFNSPNISYLPIEDLPQTGAHALFAGAVQYPDLHPLIAEYANTVMRIWHWYTDLEEQAASAMPSTFAVFALGLAGRQYFPLVSRYMQTCDEEHQTVQPPFTTAFIGQYGIDTQSLAVFVDCILSMEEHPPVEGVAQLMANTTCLQDLLKIKNDFSDRLRYKDLDERTRHDADELNSLQNILWEQICYAIWGFPKTWPDIIEQAPPQLQPLYQQILTTADDE